MFQPLRTNISKQHPELYSLVASLSGKADAAALEAGLPALLIELVKIRTSQINGCAFCLRLHFDDALKKGELIERLAVLPAWRETTYFTEAEMAALELSEHVAEISSSHDESELYEKVAGILTPAQVSAITWVAMSINMFNRIALTSGYPVAPKA